MDLQSTQTELKLLGYATPNPPSALATIPLDIARSKIWLHLGPKDKAGLRLVCKDVQTMTDQLLETLGLQLPLQQNTLKGLARFHDRLLYADTINIVSLRRGTGLLSEVQSRRLEKLLEDYLAEHPPRLLRIKELSIKPSAWHEHHLSSISTLALATALPNLTTLVLQNLDVSLLLPFAQSCPHLTKLHFDCDSERPHLLGNALSQMLSLQHLELNVAYRHEQPVNLAAALGNLPELVSLDISCDESVLGLCDLQPLVHLTNLCALIQCEGTSVQCNSPFECLTNLTNLKRMQLRGVCGSLVDNDIAAISSSMRGLTTLSVQKLDLQVRHPAMLALDTLQVLDTVTAQQFSRRIQLCPGLRNHHCGSLVISIAGEHQVEAATEQLRSVADWLNAPGNTWCAVANHSPIVNDRCMVKLDGGSNTEALCQLLRSIPPMPTFRQVETRGNTTDGALACIATAFPSTTSLFVYNSASVTAKGVASLGRLQHLSTLEIIECPNVSQSALVALAVTMPASGITISSDAWPDDWEVTNAIEADLAAFGKTVYIEYMEP